MYARLLICMVVSALTGCDVTDPYAWEGTWRPNDANEVNLRSMVVSPADLAIGVASAGGDGQQAAAALDRQRNDKTRKLPDSAVAKIVPISGGAGSQSGSP